MTDRLTHTIAKKLAKKAAKGEDIGHKGKMFGKVAARAATEYGSAKIGEKVAAAAMWKNAAKGKK